MKVTNLSPAKNILVLSPHPDDDVIGCGGTIYLHYLTGGQITVAYLTNGEKGSPYFSRGMLIKYRHREALRSAKIIGIKKTIFMDERDGALKVNSKIVRRLKEVLESAKPQIVYLPSLWDTHPDHKQTNLIWSMASSDADSYQMYGYECAGPLYPNCFIDITSVFNIKQEALRQHITQLLTYNYMELISRVNSYRASYLQDNKIKYAEGFFCSDPKNYLKLLRDEYKTLKFS